MNVIIHDLDSEQFKTLFPNISQNTYVISDNSLIRNCIGCFGCWIKTPGKCVIKDGYENMGEILSQSDNVVIICKCCYGGYSPFVKNVLDRSISYLLPFFKTKNSETHHKPRYKNRFQLSVYFYGEKILLQEMETARDLVKANSVNFNVSQYKVTFYKSLNQLFSEVKFYEN